MQCKNDNLKLKESERDKTKCTKVYYRKLIQDKEGNGSENLHPLS